MTGTRAGRVIDLERIAQDVRRYLADCVRFREILSPKYHPALESCLKAVYHAGGEKGDEAAAIRAEYQRQNTLRAVP